MLLLTGILTVLKIIGIVLLVILAVILLLLLLVLFAPIRYKADASVPRSDLDNFDVEKVSAKVGFSWLLFVIRGGLNFPESKEFTLRVFGIKILPKKEKPGEDSKDKDKDSEKDADKDSADESGKADKKEKKKRGKDKDSEKDDETAKPEDSGLSEEHGESDSSFAQGKEDEEGAAEDGEPKNILDVIWKVIDTIDNILKTPLDVLEKLQYTISRVCGKISMVKSTLESETFDRAFTLVKKKLLKILRMILPDKFKADVVFGSVDPALTAELMGVYGAFYHLLYNKVFFAPDFEEKVLEGEVHMKGHITLFTIVWSAAVVYLNRDVKRVIKRFKKIINS
ncbi:MAG: DUF2953 domain-containing protein [Butyrivibrio sp.]|nr:DUF2953 domain-containing protein [Butyrivibrio sp.]